LVNDEEWQLSLPQRRYELLAEITAEGISSLGDIPPAIRESARRRGREEAARSSSLLAYREQGGKAEDIVKIWADEARKKGLKVRPVNGAGESGALIFLSCPFGGLSRRYPELICDIHRYFEEGFLSLVGEWRVEKKPAQTGCCLYLRKEKRKNRDNRLRRRNEVSQRKDNSGL
jgi:hypothetical protein